MQTKGENHKSKNCMINFFDGNVQCQFTIRESNIELIHSQQGNQLKENMKSEARNIEQSLNDTTNNHNRNHRNRNSIEDFKNDIQKKKQSRFNGNVKTEKRDDKKICMGKLIQSKKEDTSQMIMKSESRIIQMKQKFSKMNMKEGYVKLNKNEMRLMTLLKQKSGKRDSTNGLKNMHFLFHTTQTQMNVNHCRICGIIIPEKFNGGPALRCSKHREKKDEELSILIEETIGLDAENDYLRNRFFDTENNYEKLNREHHKLKKRYDMLRKRHCDDVRKISESNRENARLTKKNEEMNRVFMQKCEEMRKEIFDLNKKVEEQYHTIQQYEQGFANGSYHGED